MTPSLEILEMISYAIFRGVILEAHRSERDLVYVSTSFSDDDVEFMSSFTSEIKSLQF